MITTRRLRFIRRPRAQGALALLAGIALLALAAPAAAGPGHAKGKAKGAPPHVSALHRSHARSHVPGSGALRQLSRGGRVGHEVLRVGWGERGDRRGHVRRGHDRHERRGHVRRGPDRHERRGHVRRGHDRHERRGHVRRGHRDDHAKWKRTHRKHRKHDGHWKHRRHHDRHGHAGRHGHSRVSVWICKPCGHRFASKRAFHGHLHGHHHVPSAKLPQVILQVGLSAIFSG